MTKFSQAGSAYMPSDGHEYLLDSLPIGNFVVAASLMGFYFQKVADFELPPKIYGDFHQTAERILSTFLDRPNATGVLLAGEKGSGKTQLARVLSVKGYDVGIPTIMCNSAWHGDGFAALLQAIEGPAIVLMDEFEKVYGAEEQEAVLTLLDGAMTSKKLFIMTVNDKWKINQNMKNRPGRIYYALDFDGLDSSFVREYCEDNLKNQEHTDSVVRVSAMFEKFNFDILKALVEEMNRYNENPYDALKLLNAKPVEYQNTGMRYLVNVTTPAGFEWRAEDVSPNATPLNTRNGEMAFYTSPPAEAEIPDLDTDEELYIKVMAADCRKLDAERGHFEFLTQNGYRVVFQREKPKVFNPYDVMYD